MKRAMGELEMNEQTLPPSILVGGTNGKGSTSGMLWRLLALSGVRCGLYTSPHVISFHERIQVSHRNLDLEFLETEIHILKTKLSADLYNELTFFELTTLLALYVFKKTECQLMILEVGLGGRWDATNAVEPLASAIVSIDFDHQEWLGTTLQAIAGEKLGIARANKPLFWGDLRRTELEETLQAAHKQVGFDLYRANRDFAWDAEECKGVFQVPSFDSFSYALPNWLEDRAEILKSNFVLAFSIYYWVLHQRLLSNLAPNSKALSLRSLNSFGMTEPEIVIPKELRDLSLSSTSFNVWPYSFLGRMQRMRVQGKTKTWDFYLDVCHNIASVRECVRTLQSAGVLNEESKKLTGFVSILRDKDLDAMIELLREILEPFVLFKIDNERSISEERLAQQHNAFVLYENFETLWDHLADKVPSPIVVCGSFYAVGKVIDYFKAYPKTFSGQSMLYALDPRDQHDHELTSSTISIPRQSRVEF